MSGHNKWSQIKRKKAAVDQQRGKIISKHIRAIQTAVREGGGADPATNLALKNALAAAKTDDVPVDNVDRAIERAVGGAEGGDYEAVTYEGYGPAGVAFLVEALTDNRNRTAAEVRHAFTKHGGNMSGSTAWQFDAKGVIVVTDTREALQEAVIDLGADDLAAEDGELTIYTPPSDLYRIADGLRAEGAEPTVAQLTKVPQSTTAPEGGDASKVMRLIDALEDLDDVQNVYTTAELEPAEPVG